MQFKAPLALCAAFLAAVAQGRIAFTTLPSSVKAGSPVQLSWAGSDGSPVTITLKRGPSNNLQTVSLITGNASGNSYTWTPSSDLENGSDYALQITQDDTDINYTGLFTISGGSSGSSSNTLSSASSSASASSSSSSSALASSIVSANSTTTAPSGTAPASAGVTGTSISRNTTLSRASLSTSASSTSSEAATTTSDSTSASVSPTGAAANVASNFGLLLAGIAAVAYLG